MNIDKNKLGIGGVIGSVLLYLALNIETIDGTQLVNLAIVLVVVGAITLIIFGWMENRNKLAEQSSQRIYKELAAAAQRKYEELLKSYQLEKDAELKTLREQNNALREANYQLQDRVDDQDTSIRSLEKQVAENRGGASMVMDLVDKERDKRIQFEKNAGEIQAVLQSEVNKLKQQVETLTTQNGELLGKITQKDEQIEEKDVVIKNLKEQIALQTVAIHELEKKLNEKTTVAVGSPNPAADSL